MIEHFDLQVYAGHSATGEPEYVESGDGDASWQQQMQLRLPGFDGSVSLSLEPLWREAIEGRRERIEMTLTGYETIVKMGGTMQLKQTYTVVLALRFRSG